MTAASAEDLGQLPWSRFWVPRDVVVDLDDGVFLRDPLGRYGSVLSPDVIQLAQLTSQVVVLLGEAGSGKSSIIAAHAAKSAGVRVIELRDHVQYEDIRLEVDDALSAAVGVVELYFDGLDEALVRTDDASKWLPLALRRRPPEDLARLRVRVSCRPAVWPESLTSRLVAALACSDPGQVVTLAPLRREDAHLAAEQRGVDGEKFLSSLRGHGVLPFAARPVTLTSLVADFADGVVPTSKTEVYRSLCTRLSRESSQAHHELNQTRQVGGPPVISVAGHIAALSVFGGLPTLCQSGGNVHAGGADLDLSEIATPSIAPVDVGRALDSGLISSVGPQRFRFAHRSFGEFLAAEHAHNRGLSDEDLLALVLDLDGLAVQPQLGEVAAWLASLRPEVFGRLVQLDPQVLLRSDVATQSAADRERLLRAVLNMDDAAFHASVETPALRALADPTLIALLTEILTSASHAAHQKELALEVAAGLPEMVSVLVDLACDPDERSRLRFLAVHRQHLELEVSVAARLVELLGTGELDDELRGVLLTRLWPRYLTISQALLACSAPPIAPGVHGGYSMFLTHWLCERLAVEDLPEALEWAAASFNLSSWHATAADSIFGAGLRGINDLDEAALTSLAALYVVLEGVYDMGYNQRRDVISEFAMGRERRRRLLRAVYALENTTADQREHAGAYLGRPEDFEWILEQVADVDCPDDRRRSWASCAWRAFRPFDVAEHLDALFDAKSVPEVADEFSDWFTGVEVGGERAQRMRQEYERHVALEAERAKHAAAALVDSAAVKAALADPNPRAWVSLVRALDPQDRSAAQVEIQTSVAWQALGDSEVEQAMLLAQRYVREVLPPKPVNEGWVLETFDALRAVLLARDADTLQAVPEAHWPAWVLSILVAGAGSGPSSRPARDEVLAAARRLAPAAVESALLVRLEEEAALAAAGLAVEETAESVPGAQLSLVFGVSVHVELNAVWDDDLSSVLLAWQSSRSDHIGIVETLPFLAQRGCAGAVELARQLLRGEGAATGVRSRLAAAAALTRCPDPEQHWPLIWELWLGAPDLGEVLMARWRHDSGSEAGALLAGASPSELAALFLMLSEEPAPGTASAGGGDLRRSVIGALQVAASNEAISALEGLVAQLPEDASLPFYLQEARRLRRESTWVPADPALISELLLDPERRLASSEPVFAEIVLRALRSVQAQISGETPAVADLWDHPRKPELCSPKDEPALSDWLARRLGDALRGVVVKREVEITTGFAGVKKMREVDLYLETFAAGSEPGGSPRALRLIVEDKGCWNPKVMTDMKEQLVEIYLAQTKISVGIYVVFAFACRDSGSTRSCSSCGKRSVADLRAELEAQATELTTATRKVFAVVLDGSLPSTA